MPNGKGKGTGEILPVGFPDLNSHARPVVRANRSQSAILCSIAVTCPYVLEQS